MTTEASLMPVAKGALPDAKRVLVLAPHADDEVFGCGGALALHVAAGAEIKAIVLSDGAFGAAEAGLQAALREAESRAAAAVLGYPPPEFWRLPDRGIEYGEVLVGRLIEAARAHAADLVYAPSLHEAHPDHRVLAMAAVEAVRRLGRGVRLAMYEVGAPLRPNLLLDISPVFERKREAMRCFVSQLARQRYDEHIAALNRYRTYTLPPDTVAAEAFELHDAEEIERGLLAIYASEGERQRQCGVAVAGARDVPLVSVIVRSMDRPSLAEALDSIALQTYSNIEVVLVNAKGPGHADPGAWCGRFPLRMVGADGPLHRSRAANLGLAAARGDYLIFLDDDDWFAPHHIAALRSKIAEDETLAAVYAAVRMVDEQGEEIRRFAEVFDRTQLRIDNYMPIHAVLFSRRAVDAGACFDEKLDVCEDWDFWLQIAEHGNFKLLPEIGATYRIHQEQGSHVWHDHARTRQAMTLVYRKWLPKWSDEVVWSILDYARYKRVATELQAKYQAETARADAAGREIEAMRQRAEAMEQQLRQQIDGIYASTSWKATAPLRRLSRLIQCVLAVGKRK